MTSIHDKSNAIIAACPELHVIGKGPNGHDIVRIAFEQIKGQKATIRVICYGSGEAGAIVEIAEAAEYSDLRHHLADYCKIGLKYSDMVYAECQRMWEEFDSIELFNQAAKDLSPGMINQFEANGLMYSIIHNPAFKMRLQDGVRLNPEFFTVYAQNAAIEDPDECLVDTDSFDTLFEAMTYIRNHIDKAIFAAFMPELFQ